MHFSASEFFLLGRVAAWYVVRQGVSTNIPVSTTLVSIVDSVCDEFAIDRARTPDRPPEPLAHVPADVVWQKTHPDPPQPGMFDHFPNGGRSAIAGLPCAAIGVSRADQRRLFVQRRDGEVYAWSLQPPRSGLYMMLMKSLKEYAGLTPQLWLMLHDGPWDATVDAWSSFSDMIGAMPHIAFEPDLPLDIAGMLRDKATKAGGSGPFALGYDTGVVDATLAYIHEAAKWLRFDRNATDDEGTEPSEAEQHMADLARRAVETLSSPEATNAAAGDHLVNNIYTRAAKGLEFACELYRGRQLEEAVERARDSALRATTYLYGRSFACA